LLWFWNVRKLPPGPMKLPFVGSLPFLSHKNGILDWVLDPAVTANKLSMIQLGARKLNVINDYDLAKDLFGREEFSGRHAGEYLTKHKFIGNNTQQGQGIIHSRGLHWAAQRRFALRTLKDFGFGKKSLETAINEEIDEVILHFESSKSDDFYLQHDFNVPIINILWQLIAGFRFTKDKEHEHGLRIVESVNESFQTGMKTGTIPIWFHKLFPKFTGFGRRVEIIMNQKKYFMEQIKKHEETLDESNPRDFIDVYLIELMSGSNEHLTKEDLVIAIVDMFVAGTETSSTTMKWILLYLVLNQDVQDKCRKEIHDAIGQESRFELSRLSELPYTTATVTEIQRVARVAPMSLFHATTAPTTVGPYKFPKGSGFVVNLSFISHNPEVIQDPLVFNPDRWIGADGKFFKNERIIPFGIGKRSCMGELLARNEILLFTVNLIQKLKFNCPNYHSKPRLDQYKANLTRIPNDFHLSINRI